MPDPSPMRGSRFGALIGPSVPTIGYDGRLGAVLRIAAITTFQTIVTLGIYRFWARTRWRRYLWSRITVDGEPVEYTGTGRELFFGFVKTALVLGVLLLVLRLAPLAAPVSRAIAAGQSLAIAFVYVAAGFFARRYRTSRTSWRGIRAGLAVGFWPYFRRALGYGALTIVTLGLCFPCQRIWLERFLINATRFGDRPFVCTARARSVFGRWLALWLVAILVLAAIGFAMWQNAHGQGAPQGVAAPAAIAAALALLVAPALWMAYRAGEIEALIRATRFGEVAATVDVPVSRFLLAGIGYWLLTALSLALAFGGAGWLALAMLDPLDAAALARHPPEWLIWVFGAALVVFGAFRAVLRKAVLTHCLLRIVVSRVGLRGRLEPESINQSPLGSPGTGEGLLDAFDLAS